MLSLQQGIYIPSNPRPLENLGMAFMRLAAAAAAICVIETRGSFFAWWETDDISQLLWFSCETHRRGHKEPHTLVPVQVEQF